MTEPWDRTTLNAETDERYHARHPTAPYQLDPDDSTHRPWIDAWLEIRNEVLVAATNHYFFEQHPEAPPHLDPDDSSQTYYVAEWIRIRDDILGDGVAQEAVADTATDAAEPVEPSPSTSDFDVAADSVREQITLLLGLADSTIDSSAGRYVLEQIETARSLYLGHHFDRHDEWTSPTKNFDIGVGFNDLGVQVRVVGQQRSVRMGLVGNGPSDVGGWETYRGAPTQ